MDVTPFSADRPETWSLVSRPVLPLIPVNTVFGSGQINVNVRHLVPSSELIRLFIW